MLTHKSVPYIKLFSSSSGVRLVGYVACHCI